MKKFFWLACALLSSTAFAAPAPETIKQVLENEPSCSNFVSFDQDYLYLGFGNYRNSFEEPRRPIPAKITITPFAAPEKRLVLPTLDASLGAIRDGNSLFVLTYSGIEEWNLSDTTRVAVYPTSNFSGSMAFQQHPRAFARYGDKAVIAHGRLGVSFFDLKTKKVTRQVSLIPSQLPLESMATGITIQGKYAYVVMDNFTLLPPKTKAAFRGIVVIDLTQEKVISELDGMDPGADGIVSDGTKTIVSFGGMPIWKYAHSDLQAKQMPEPERRIWRFPSKGHPMGQAAMDEKYYYSCFSDQGNEGGFSKRVPMALDRKLLLLD